MTTTPDFPPKREPQSLTPYSPAPLCLGVHRRSRGPPPNQVGLISAVMPESDTISKLQEAREVRERGTTRGQGGRGLVTGGWVGSLWLGCGRPIKFRGHWPRPGLCLLNLLLRCYALLQSEDLAHCAGGEGEGAAPVQGRDPGTEIK